MRKAVAIIGFVFMAVAVSFGQPSHKRAPVVASSSKYPSVFPINVGIKGSLLNNLMVYSALHTAQTPPLIMVDGGVALEWHSFEHLSVGLDVTYASRGTRKTFRTEFLTSYPAEDMSHSFLSATARSP